MGEDKYKISIQIDSLEAEYSLPTQKNRGVALQVYAELLRNYSKPENISIIKWDDPRKPEKVILSDIEKKTLGIK